MPRIATLRDRRIDRLCRKALKDNPDEDPFPVVAKKLGTSIEKVIASVQRVGIEKRINHEQK